MGSPHRCSHWRNFSYIAREQMLRHFLYCPRRWGLGSQQSGPLYKSHKNYLFFFFVCPTFLPSLEAATHRLSVEQQIQSEPRGDTPRLSPQIPTITVLYPEPLNCPRVGISYIPYNHQLSKENRTNWKCLQKKKKNEHWKVITVKNVPLHHQKVGARLSWNLPNWSSIVCLLFLFWCGLFFWDRIPLCSAGCLGTHCQSGWPLTYSDLQALAFLTLELKACISSPG